MKKIVECDRLMIKVCDLYYNQGKTHMEIATELGMSRPTVSRILSNALEKGIVKISIARLDSVKFWELEQKLKERFGLEDVVIVDEGTTEEEMKSALGEAAAGYLEHVVKEEDIVGVAMGSTLYYTAHTTVARRLSDLTVVPLIGGMGRLQSERHANHLAEHLAKAYGGRFYPLYAPARVSVPSVSREFMKEGSVEQVLELQKSLSVALVGIGYPNEKSSIQATGYYEDNEIQSLLEREVVGEICMQFYDISGDTSRYKADNRVIGIELNKLKRIPYVIGVAGGLDKIPAVQGAIHGRYINVLITDRVCAEELLKC